jgi:tRNA pseudouridine38-40 synthase
VGIEYDGTRFNGWQVQDHAPSIQSALNGALSIVANETVNCVGAGRTDAGVHAAGQVAHFDSAVDRPIRSWLLGINSNLPAAINALWVRPVAADFHARYSARSRVYKYLILNRPVRSALMRERAWWVRRPLNIERMQAAARHLRGEHDFSAFRAAGCQARSADRHVQGLECVQEDERIVVECAANAFLHHMVRNIVGSLVRVGCGDEEPEWVASLLESRDRRLAGVTAPARGLCLVCVHYPERFDLPVADYWW